MRLLLHLLGVVVLSLCQQQPCGGTERIQCAVGYECRLDCPPTVIDCVGRCEVPSCSWMVCSADRVCVEDPVKGGRCAPLEGATCSTTQCDLGYECKDHPDGAVCVPLKLTCATIACIATTKCKDHPDKGAVCVPIDLPTCDSFDCPPGALCKDDDYFGAVCHFDCQTEDDWSLEKLKWCCDNEKKRCPTDDICKDGETKEINCNTCVCERGSFRCTEKACLPPPPGGRCTTDSDCSDDKFCRRARTPSKGSSGCSGEKVCAPRAAEGEPCGGFTPSCDQTVCLPSLKCVPLNVLLPDAPGVCTRPILSVGDVCRVEKDAVTVLDRSNDCPKGSKCSNEGEGWTCVGSFCSPDSCDANERCVVADGGVKCLPNCDLQTNNLMILCGVDGICPNGYQCTGCQPTCSCDTNGAKVCSKECRPTCEEIEDESDCLTQPITEWKSLGCKTFTCFGYVKSPSLNEMTYCCEATGRYCDVLHSDGFDCKSDPKGWSYNQTKWCCEQNEVGCPVPLFDCHPDENSMRVVQNPDGLLQTTAADVRSEWSDERAAYCCDRYQVGCRTEEDFFDCEWSSQTHAAWSERQTEWCCSVKGVRCPVVVPDVGDVERCQVKWDERSLWDEETRKYCCLVEGAGCASEKFDCYGDSRKLSEWSADQREWCCEEENIGCRIDCRAPHTDTDKHHCCEMKGLHCPPSQEEDHHHGQNHTISFRLSFKGSIAKVMDNPKRFLRTVRRTLLRAVVGVKANGLLVKYAGGLMNGSEVPPQDARQRWGVAFRYSWNSKLFADEEGDVSTSRGVGVLGHGVSTSRGLQSLGDDEEVFVEFDVSDSNKDTLTAGTESLVRAVDEAKVGLGPFQDNNDGSTMIIIPVADGLSELPSPDQNQPHDSSDNNTTTMVLIWLMTTLCLGGVAALTVYLKKYKQSSSSSPDGTTTTSSFTLLTQQDDQAVAV